MMGFSAGLVAALLKHHIAPVIIGLAALQSAY